jgi:hypothetical protein
MDSKGITGKANNPGWTFLSWNTLTPTALLQVRDQAVLKDFGLLQYRFRGARTSADLRVLMPPHYAWCFIYQPVEEAEEHRVEHALEPLVPGPVFKLEASMQEALTDLAIQGGSVHLPDWGLLVRSAEWKGKGHCLELMPDPGRLQEEHPHYAWESLKLADAGNSEKQPEKAAEIPETRIKSPVNQFVTIRRAGIFALWCLVLVMGVRWLLRWDGSEPWAVAPMGRADLGQKEGMPKLPETRAAAEPDALRDTPVVIATMEGKDLQTKEATSSPSSVVVVVGTYRSDSMAQDKARLARSLGYEVRVFDRVPLGRDSLQSVGLIYRGTRLKEFLARVRSQVTPNAWILEDQAS